MNKIDPENPFEGITDCAAHGTVMEEDCQYCEAEFRAKNEVVELLTQDAMKGANDLASHGCQMPENYVVNIRLELLIESILKDRNRVHFEVEVARRVLHGIGATKKDLARQRLTNGKGGLVVPTSAHMKR